MLSEERLRRTFLFTSEKELVVSGDGFKYVFNRTDGQLTSMVVQDMELLESPLRLNLWRAPLANELDNWNASSARFLQLERRLRIHGSHRNVFCRD